MTGTLDDLTIVERDVKTSPGELRSDGDNPNEQDDDTYGHFMDGINAGWVGGPIVANTGDLPGYNGDPEGLICDGEHRWRAAQDMGRETVPVTFVDFDSDSQRRYWRQHLNKVTGEHDTKRDALEYDYLLDAGYAEEVHELTKATGEDLDELLAEIKMETSASPAYEYDPEHNVYFEDCVEGMRERLDDDSVDMVFTSPPYNIGKEASGDRTRDTEAYNDSLPEGEYREFLLNVFDEIARVVKPDGHVFINHQNHYADGHVEATTWINELMSMTPRSYICWFKGGQSTMASMSQQGRFYPAWEPIYHFSESDSPLNGTRFNDHWDIRAAVGGTQDSKDAGEHPAPYPVELPKRAIKATCDDDAVVLDPFMGSGTTAVAAVEYGCDYVGFELDEEGAYKPIIERRIGEAKRQRDAGVNAEAKADD